jgi:hypothetical protein
MFFTYKGEKMAKTLKFIYNVILFVFLFLVLTFGESKFILKKILLILLTILFTHLSNISVFVFHLTEQCSSDIDCYKLYPEVEWLFCHDGTCKYLL